MREDWDKIQAQLADLREALEQLRGISDLPPGYWPERVPDPLNLFKEGTPRYVCRFVCASAMASFLKGDHEEACQSLRDVLTMTRTIDVERTHLLNLLVSIGIDAMVANLIKEYGPWLAIESGDETNINAASRETVHALMRDLEAIGPSKRYMQALYVNTRFERFWLTQWHSGHTVGFQSTPHVMQLTAFEPLFLQNELDRLNRIPRLAICAEATHWDLAMRQLESCRHPQYGPYVEVVLGSFFYARSVDEASLRNQFIQVANARLAVVLLAIRMYEVDHGHKPSALRDLLKEVDPGPYLMELPVDPFGDGIATFCYVPNGENPRIYSLGLNGVDDGGIERDTTKSGPNGDLVFSLTGHPDAEPFATRPLEVSDDAADEELDDEQFEDEALEDDALEDERLGEVALEGEEAERGGAGAPQL